MAAAVPATTAAAWRGSGRRVVVGVVLPLWRGRRVGIAGGAGDADVGGGTGGGPTVGLGGAGTLAAAERRTPMLAAVVVAGRMISMFWFIVLECWGQRSWSDWVLVDGVSGKGCDGV